MVVYGQKRSLTTIGRVAFGETAAEAWERRTTIPIALRASKVTETVKAPEAPTPEHATSLPYATMQAARWLLRGCGR